MLVGLLVTAMVFVLGYVIHRRAKNRTAPAPVVSNDPLRPAPSGDPVANPPVDLRAHEGKTIDFSSGRPEVRDSTADRTALDTALREMSDATQDVKFAPPAGAASVPTRP